MYKNYLNIDINVIKSNLATRGYSIVDLNESFLSNVKICEQEMNEFFNQPIEEKEPYFREPVFGWFEVPHKQVFRIATGNRMNNYDYPSTQLKNLIPDMDAMMTEFANLLFPGVNQLTKVPFDFGLIDVVLYNNNTERKNNLNIVEHYDAGLLAFNFLNTADGLQFKNEHDEWIDIPSHHGIIWTSNAIKSYESSHPVGIHRVKTTDKPRLSMWYEVATYEQLREDIKNGEYKGYDYEIELMKKEGYKAERDDKGNIIRYNKEIGWKAVEAITTGSNKTAVGTKALNFDNHVAIGFEALKTGEEGKAFGWKTLESMTTGSNKVALGYNSLYKK
jgi:hypothetical protein